MKTDRELLELAAKAYFAKEVADDVCSFWWDEKEDAIVYIHADNQDYNGNDVELLWIPNLEDGDALRLAVRLGFLVDSHGMHARVCFPYEAPLAYEPMSDDPYAATRRAIVRAAAAIGENMA